MGQVGEASSGKFWQVPGFKEERGFLFINGNTLVICFVTFKALVKFLLFHERQRWVIDEVCL